MMEVRRESYGVAGLRHLVADSILGRGGTGAEILVGVLGDLLVGLLGSTAGHLAGLVSNIVGSVP